MKKKLVTVLVVIALVLVLLIAGALGFVWYRNHHVFVEGDAYPISATELDLTEKDISLAYYEELKAKLPNCEIRWMVPFHEGKYANDTENLTVSSLTLEDVEFLAKYFPGLKELDASQCDAYEVLAVADETLTDCELKYYVKLGHPSQSPHYQSEFVQLGFGELLAGEPEYDFDELMANLTYLTELKELTLENPVYTAEQVESLKEAYPEVKITCTVEILGQKYDAETTELDLSALTAEGMEAVLEKLPLLPKLTYVKLTDAEGNSQLTKEDVKTLMAEAPSVVFDYSFDFFGTTLSTADEEVVMKNTRIGDDNEAEIRLALDLLTNCKRFVLDSCGMSDEVMEVIRNDYRGRTKVVWRVWFGGGHTLTDAEVIRCTYDLVDDNCHDLIYCEDVRFVDFGHNEWLDSCDFVAGMTSLEYCILSGAPIKDLTPFANCRNLKFLEIAFCEYVTDLTPLASCEQLQMLNISNTHALDLTPLDKLPLTHFCARTNPSGRSRIAADEQARFIAQHPDCWTSFDGAQPYGVGWRYDEDEITPLPQYSLVQVVFQLPHAPNNVGWYLKEEALAKIAEVEAIQAAKLPAVTEETLPAVEETAPEETVPEETEVMETIEETETTE